MTEQENPDFCSSPLTISLLKHDKDSIPKIPHLENVETIHFHEYKYRYLICFFYAMSNVALNIIYIACGPITADLKHAYELSDIAVSATSLMYLVFYLPANFPSNYILDKYGIRVGITVGTILTLIGSWIRILVNHNFLYVILGGFIGSIGQPLIFNTPPKIAAYWFKPENRVKATTFLSVVSPIGVGIGFFIPGMVVGDRSTMSVDQYKSNVWDLFFYQSLVFTILCAPCLLFFKEKPLTPPSYSADFEKSNFREAVKKSFRSKSFLMLLTYFALSYGALNSFSIVINVLIEPFGYNSFDTSLIGVVLIVAGLLGSFAISMYVARTNYYKYTLIGCTIGYAASIFMLALCVYSENLYIGLIPIIFLGFFGFPILPIAFEMGCEISFPVGEAFTTGLLVSVSQILATVATVILELVMGEQTKTTATISFGVFFGFIVVGLIFLLIMKEEFNRSDFEKRHKKRKGERLSGSFVSLFQSIIEEKEKKELGEIKEINENSQQIEQQNNGVASAANN